MADDRIKLGLDLTDTNAKAKALAGSLTDVRNSAQGVADTYEVLAVSGQGYELVGERLDDLVTQEVASAGRAAQANRDLAASKQAVARAAGGMGKAADETNQRLGSLSRGVLQTSQAFQDIAQGGVAAALNNVDGIVWNLGKSFGVTTAAATAFSAAALGLGTVVLLAAPAVRNLWEDMTAFDGVLPTTTDNLGKLNDELKTHKARLEEIAERNGALSADDIAAYVAGQREVLAIEKEIADTKLEAALREILPDKELADRRKQGAKVKELVAKDQDELIDLIKKKAAEQSEAVVEARNKQAQALTALNERLGGIGILNPFGALADVKKADEAAKGVEDAMRRAGLAGLEGLKKAFEGDNDALKSIIKMVGPQSKFAEDLNKALGEVWKPEEAWKGLAERGGKVLSGFFDKFDDEIKKRVKKSNDEFDRWVEGFEDKLKGLNDRMRKELEDAQWAEATDKNAQGAEIIRDVENRDFFRSGVDRNGRAFETPGLGLSSQQVDAATNAAREMQRAAREGGGGLSDREAAQLAIQEQLMLNQQAMANRQQQFGARVNGILNQAQAVPSILDWGMGW